MAEFNPCGRPIYCDDGLVAYCGDDGVTCEHCVKIAALEEEREQWWNSGIDQVREDMKRLDWLESQSKPGLQWIARHSIMNRGYRLHQDDATTNKPMFPTARQALDAAREATQEGDPK